MVRAELVKQLQRSEKTRQGVVERFAVENPITCSGVCKGMVSQEINRVAQITGWLDPVTEDGSKPPAPVALTLEFAELAGAADALLMGFPDLVKYDVRVCDDADGNVWVVFERLGVTMLAEVKSGKA